MNLVTLFGIIGIIFLLNVFVWFIAHPVSRDKVLVKFGWKYMTLVLGIMVSSVCIIAWRIQSNSLESIEIAKQISANSPDSVSVEEFPYATAIRYCVKMDSPDKSKFGLSVYVMIIQILVFEGLVLAGIVGWTSRRAKRSQHGKVYYSKSELKGCIYVSIWDSLKIDQWLSEKWEESKLGIIIAPLLMLLIYCVYPIAFVIRLLFFCWWYKPNAYAVVIGANEVAPSVIKNLLKHEDEKKDSLNYAHEEENQYVILQTSSEIGEVRQTLRAYLTEEEYNRVIIYSDIRYSYEGLRALHIDDASEIYVLGENTTIDGGETYHDTMNMRCVNLIADILVNPEDYQTLKTKKKDLSKLEDKPENKETKKQLQGEIDAIVDKFDSKKRACKVLFEYQTTYSVFQFSDVPDKVRYAMHFIPFNRYESWARRVMVDNKALALVDENDNSKCNQQINYTPLDGYKGIKPEDTQRVHFIVVGMSKMGVAMGTQALFQAHYPNYVRGNSLKSRITFIDANAEQEMQFFKGRYASLFELARHRYIDAKDCKDDQLNSDYQWIDPMLDPKTKWKHLSAKGANFLDVEIEFVKGELESESVREYLRQVTADMSSKVTIAICLPLTHQSVAAALYMPNEVYDNVQEIWVYQREAADIIQNLTQGKKEDLNIRYKKLKPFGMLYGEYIDSRTYYLKALLVNGIYDIEDVDNPMYSSKLDMGKKKTFKQLRTSWNKLTVEKTWSNKYFVDTIYQKIRSTDLVLSEEAAIIGYNNDKFFTRNWKEDLDNALDKLSNLKLDELDKKYLAECEHNRWNVQQLLLGFRPADRQEDENICKQQEEVKREVAPIKEEISNYMNDNNIQRLKELNDRIQYTKGDVKAKSFKSLLEFIGANAKLKVDAELLEEIKEMAQKEEKIAAQKENLEKKKKDLKSPKNKVHYCICDFSHLEAVDPGAKRYDEKLNNGIPKILELVDGYHCGAQQ